MPGGLLGEKPSRRETPPGTVSMSVNLKNSFRLPAQPRRVAGVAHYSPALPAS